MPKINREEYEVLKALDSRAKSIVRQARGWLWVAEQPIMKDDRSWFVADGFDEKLKDDNLFQFIQWEDEEPHNIAELIEEYEGEKTEVKNIEWLKKEVNTEMIRLEPHRAEKWSDVKYQTLRDVAQKLNQLDEPEVLSQEWIDEHLFSLGDKYPWKEAVPVVGLQNLLVPNISEMETVDITEGQIMDWLDDNDFFHHATAETVLANAVDKGELGYYGTKYYVVKKPVIPNYVAKWISEHHEKFDLYPALRRLEEGSTRDYDAYKWYRKNTRKFVNAYLTGEYEVEEEPKYYALVKGHELTDSDKVYWVHDKSHGDMFIGTLHLPSVYFLSEMSKSEWNELGINDSNADFVKVGEIQE